MASKYGEPVTNKITLNESIINTDLIHLNICLWYLWYLTTNLMRLISVNQSWTTRMMWHTDIRKAAWCKDCNNKLRCLKHWYLKYLRYSQRNEKHCFNVNEPIRAHRTLSASLHCDYVSVLKAMERKFTPSCFNWSKIWDLHLKFLSYMNITYVPTCISTQFSAVLYSGGIFFSWRIILSRTEGLMMGWKIKK